MLVSIVNLSPNNMATRQNAVEDAKEMQASVAQDCVESGKEPPPYLLLELIGKGSFGRVYKARGTKPGQLVAVKIINIENGDALDPSADTFSDILKEIETLKLLDSGGAKNVNTVVDALLVGHTMWMVTEYCAGGSVSTLMKPRGRLPEQWIIPILREVAEAIFWVHKQGIIHRDIKCANVLVTEVGSVQLCDFGVAGIIQNSFDKRSTITGSLHWMAPELFNPAVRYGTEVDIWAFGSMAYEVASGLPPNAAFRDIPRFGAYLKNHCPRLEGDQYSPGLKNLIACCIVEDPSQRPPIEQLQQHPYIYGTEMDYPTESLSRLVHAYKLWEAQGGSRTSLFSLGGAQREPTSDLPSLISDEWNFSTLDDLGQLAIPDSLQSVLEAYDTNVDVRTKPSNPYPRRRKPPPPNIKMPVAPLQRLFDPNTTSNYQDNARDFYARGPMTSELPLRDGTQNVRESLIDLDAALGDVVPQSADLSTVRPLTRSLSSDLTDAGRRRTLDWTFPTEAPVSATPGFQHSPDPVNSDGEPTLTQAQRGLVAEFPPDKMASDNRASAFSIIDLDASLPDDLRETSRPSTADSDTPSDIWRTPFDLEKHTPKPYPSAVREPSIYIGDGDFSVSTAVDVPEEPSQTMIYSTRQTSQHHLPAIDSERDEPSEISGESINVRQDRPAAVQLPPLPEPPTAGVMQGTEAGEDVKGELLRLISSFKDHLGSTRDFLETLPVRSGHVVQRPPNSPE
ncbi:kinase-like protein [Durotheca rogersii]|uniref:kinase-like protein n=1 Tax=Durotheca rogersii TaxID=419775 RepID=UPI00222126D2|nr:kinase-like protein [Durotheca rogersii]KAI5863972.1 kinase-like protein [Durotheca rogersii]